MRARHIIAAVAASLVATIGMAAEPQRSFTHDGRTYAYTITEADGARIIAGRQLPAGAPFRLVVRKGRVTGSTGSTPVSFRVQDAAGATGGLATTAGN